MEQNAILYPVVSLVFLTFGIGIWLGKLRFAAVKNGDLNPSYYALNRGGKIPDYLAKVNNNYDNLLALPILFYLISILLFLTNHLEVAQVIMAWVFVGSRYVHSYIHTTYNDVRHRARTFLFGLMVLIIMWALFLVRMLQT